MHTTLNTIKTYLEQRFIAGGCNWQVKLGPVEKEGQTEEDLLITLLRVEEETSVKQPTAFHRTSDISGHYANPDVCLNLYILISSHASYEVALKQINDTIYYLNSIYHEENLLDNDMMRSIKKLSIELQSPNAEQYNSLWQTLGGKVVPCVVYKVRMITISAIAPSNEVKLIEKVHVDRKSLLRMKIEHGKTFTEEEAEELLNVLEEIKKGGIVHFSPQELRFLFGRGKTLDVQEQAQLAAYLIGLRENNGILSAEEENLISTHINNY